MTKKPKKAKPVKAWCWKEQGVLILSCVTQIRSKLAPSFSKDGEYVRVEIREIKDKQ